MNSRQIITIIVVAVAALAGGYFIGTSTGGPKTEGQISLNNEADSINYFLGVNQGYALQGLPFEPDAELIYVGMNQVLNDTSMYDAMTAQNIFRQLQISLADRESRAADQESISNLEEGAVFLEENAQREGVITTESGLQYEVIEEGTGPKPNEDSEVTVMYEGELVDGTVFDSSYERGDSVTFNLDGVIPGWTEGLQKMSVGSTYKFYIPSHLAYGERATGPIPGNSVLVFKVELLDIE